MKTISLCVYKSCDTINIVLDQLFSGTLKPLLVHYPLQYNQGQNSNLSYFSSQFMIFIKQKSDSEEEKGI